MFLLLLRCVAKAAVKNSGKFLISTIPGGTALYDVALDSYQAYRQQRDADDLRAEVRALAAASAEFVQAEVQAAVKAVASNQSPEVQEKLAAYLSQLPASIRRSLRRPSDVIGTTVPAGFIKSGEDLLRILPSKASQFRPGQRPLRGVDWELVELLGVGGFGEVWKARHTMLKARKPVALKFCDPAAAKELQNEAGLLDRLQRHGHHPGIVPLLNTYLTANPPCLEYELVEGGELTGILREWLRTGPIPIDLVFRLFENLVRTVGFAHSAKIVHCDLKPANILVERLADGKLRLRITDFGIGGLAARQILDCNREQMTSRPALVTQAVRGSCTPLYASPQQKSRKRGDPADPRDDVHALGVIWYQLLSGDLGIDAMPHDWPDNLKERGVPASQAELLKRCIASKAERRPANAMALAKELAALVGERDARSEVFIAINGQKYGPYSQEQFQALQDSRKIPAESFYWQQGMKKWEPITETISPDPAQGKPGSPHGRPQQPRKPVPVAPIAPPKEEPTVLSCNHCKGPLVHDAKFAGQTVVCPHCCGRIVMPEGPRIDLAVSYDDKDVARAAGARWDPTRRVWYAPNEEVAKRVKAKLPRAWNPSADFAD